MARKSTKARARAGGPERVQITRDQALLSPKFCDFSSLVFGSDFVIHTLFQTEIPLGELPTSGKIPSVLIGRYLYPPDHFKALTALFLRQYVAFEQNRGKKQEALGWLSELLQQQRQDDGTTPAPPATAPLK